MKKILIGIAVLTSVASADKVAEELLCVTPMKPSEFRSQGEVTDFSALVSLYKTCVEDFVQRQEEGMAVHKKAAESAVVEFNEFVKRTNPKKY